jgi:hypothetical protein
MLGIEDKWVALAYLLCIALPLSLLTVVVVSSFTQKSDEAHLDICFSYNKKNNETKI